MRGALPTLPADHPAIAVYRVLDDHGVADPGRVPPLPPREWLRLYEGMVRIRVMDERLMALQRQGRIGFYGEARGQEAAVVGSAAALGPKDWLVPALREAGGGLLRGLPLRHYIAQIFGNANDPAQGRQMPCHPGTREARYVTMSSCIGTQLPHAVGLAMAAKLRRDPVVVGAYLGDGATSEADFHVALNFAGVFKAPVVFICQNNQWAISTPASRQTASPSLAVKALGYGFDGVRVDGNDALAVYDRVKSAVDRARDGGGPTLVECLTYRVSAHTSSDDPSRYRDESITLEWKQRDPIARMRTWLLTQGYLTVDGDEELRHGLEGEIREAVAAEEAVALPPVRSLFEDVFAEVPAFLDEQYDEIAGLPRQKTGGVHQ